MAQFKRFSGSVSERYNSSYVGEEGELTWDPDNGLRIHDGNQNGGQQIGITSYNNLNDKPVNLATIQSGSNTNHRQFLRYNKDTYAMEFADDFKVRPYADISYPNGVVGDKVGDIAFTSDSIYYCHTEPNFIGTATLGDASGYSPGGWIVLTSIPESGPVQLGNRLTDGNITSTVEEIVEGWPGVTGSRMIVRMSADISWHSGMTGTVLSVISSGEGVSTGNWVKFSKSYNDLTNKPTIPEDVSDLTDTTNLLPAAQARYEMKSADFTAVAGKTYWLDTGSSAKTVTLPASPTAGDWVKIYDGSMSWQTYNLTVDGNGNNVKTFNMPGGWNTAASTGTISQSLVSPAGPFPVAFIWDGSNWYSAI